MAVKQKQIRITKEDETPLVKSLLDKVKQCYDALDEATQVIEKLKAENQQLRDELAQFQKRSKKPKIKPSKDRQPKKSNNPKEKRPGSEKRSKKKDLAIHEQRIIPPDFVPEGSKLKRRRSYMWFKISFCSKRI